MEKAAIKDLVYGGLEELLNNKAYYYRSSIGQEYCHLTDSGKEAVTEFISLMAAKVHQANEKDLDKRAKEMVIKELKGSS